VEKVKTNFAVEGDNLSKMTKTVGLGAIEVATILDNYNPDMVLTVADRFETIATAIAASYCNIPLIHLQGGEVSGTIDNKVRNAITQLADIHFPASFLAKERLLKMKPEDSKNIFSYGCPSMDLLIKQPNVREIWGCKRDKAIADANDYFFLWDYLTNMLNHRGVGAEINLKHPFVIVLMHPDTTEGVDMTPVKEALEETDVQKVIFWNNIDPGAEDIAKVWRMSSKMEKTRFVRHIDPEDFGALLLLSRAIVGNSSTGVRESSFLGTPSVLIGDRQHGRQIGENAVRVPFNKTEIKMAIEERRHKKFRPTNLYGDGDAGRQIANIIGEYCHGRKRLG
jgi:UDP-hydrolysing UDP-N-acetyl-D-glucosamine 2-epimerase